MVKKYNKDLIVDQPFSKVRVNIGYLELVMERDAAFALFEAFGSDSVEQVDSKWDDASKTTSKALKKMDNILEIKHLAHEDYVMWKLAGAAKA